MNDLIAVYKKGYDFETVGVHVLLDPSVFEYYAGTFKDIFAKYWRVVGVRNQLERIWEVQPL